MRPRVIGGVAEIELREQVGEPPIRLRSQLGVLRDFLEILRTQHLEEVRLAAEESRERGVEIRGDAQTTRLSFGAPR